MSLKNESPLNTSVPNDRVVYSGQVVYMFAYDLAYDMVRPPISTLLDRRVEEYVIGPSKRSPKQLFFFRPQRIIFGPDTYHIRGTEVEVTYSVKIFPIGAISIQVRVPFQRQSLASLVAYHNLEFDQKRVSETATSLGTRVLEVLRPYCTRPVAALGDSEAYTVFQLDLQSDMSEGSAEAWFSAHRQEIAGLLTEESEPDTLSDQETCESTQDYLSYYTSDLAVMDWDAALIVTDPENVEDTLHIMEVANVQLLELNVYDRTLDTSLENVYRDLKRRRSGGSRKIHQNLRELRVDMARFNDELLNITKFFGDWHLARLYQRLAGRFHLNDWNRIINEKLKTLAELYQLLQQDSVNFWMVVLESTIVLLFIMDLAVLIAGL